MQRLHRIRLCRGFRGARLASPLFGALAFIAGCIEPQDNDPGGEAASNRGAVELALLLAPGKPISAVDYNVEGNGIAPRTGSMDVSDPGATVSLYVAGLPTGDGYRITLAARTTDEKTVCAGSAPFSIVTGRTTAVWVDLECRDVGPPGGRGAVSVMGNRCPSVGAVTANPAMVAPGEALTLLASGFDPDTNDRLTYRWTSANGGTFSDFQAANTQFRTTQVGRVMLKLTVSDGHCQDSKDVVIACRDRTAVNVPAPPSADGAAPVAMTAAAARLTLGSRLHFFR